MRHSNPTRARGPTPSSSSPSLSEFHLHPTILRLSRAWAPWMSGAAEVYYPRCVFHFISFLFSLFIDGQTPYLHLFIPELEPRTSRHPHLCAHVFAPRRQQTHPGKASASRRATQLRTLVSLALLCWHQHWERYRSGIRRLRRSYRNQSALILCVQRRQPGPNITASLANVS